MSLKAVSIEIRGKVQGVWYRASAKKEADRLNIMGFVKNQENGSVYMEVFGDVHAISLLLGWCLQGPELAQVSEILVKNIDPIHFTDFTIESTKNAGH